MAMRNPRTYLLIALSSFTLLAVVFLANATFLFRAGELEGAAELIAAQQNDHAIVNTLYVSLPYLKYQTYRARAPEIVAVGTSRAMQFREYHFTRPFYNLGGVNGKPPQYLNTLEQLFREAPPKVALVVIDFWTYCHRAGKTPDPVFATAPPPSAKPASIVRLPVELLAEGKLSAKDYVAVLRQGVPEVNGLRFLGVTGSLRMNGFARDGSRYTFASPTHLKGAPLSGRWRETLQRIESGTSNFRRNCTLDRAKVDALLFEFIERLKSLGTQPVLIFGPLPQATLQAMAGHPQAYAYVDELRRYVAEKASVPVFDYHQGADIGSPDCEFRDGFHGGEITYMRMLLDAAGRPQSPLAGYVDEVYLARAVANHPGRLTVGSAFIRQSMAAYFEREAGAEGCSGESRR